MFADRAEAGRRLAELLERWRYRHPAVLGVPRGGVPVAFEVADALDARLDVLVAHRLVVPGPQSLIVGGVAEDGVVTINHSAVQACDLTRQQVAALEAHAKSEVERQVALYRDGRPRLSLAGRTVILVDEGIATGTTTGAACRAVRRHGPCRLVVAAPVARHDVVRRLGDDADEVVALATPDQVDVVGCWYDDHHPVTDVEITKLLADHRAGRAA